MHALVWTGGWSEADARDACARTKAAGYDLLEIPLLDPSSVDAEMTRQVLDEYGLRAATSLGLSFDADVSSEDDDIVAAGEDLLNDALAAAALSTEGLRRLSAHEEDLLRLAVEDRGVAEGPVMLTMSRIAEGSKV
mgnify:CR=1 FL=1